ncbi:hypothetical protein EV207_13031 [Scopulibacillus darangshiensis]|uniref:Uncharacterized protein n=1 Tax=Scopulibacillus darangshiensis TaxID=442528 RepID=A0A4R2NPZ3_9BACL|nr:hypothetical protein [Scopulibacillus darangshiensis]TCP23511.1 hypothetical protein EV207_13031 [Scopulibacillus darangshiensis]
MHQAHGIGYAEYENSLEKRIEVEKAREKDHHKCTQITATHDNKTVKS